tara:strand:- start:3444 stop:5855 length:2412 start_codon:yes stop_codon:yes gene_type:complete
MPNVTQTVSNYLGGVSKQPDTKKLPGQLTECINAYPDPTFGLTKRPGFKFIKELGASTAYTDGKWFYIHRDGDEKYVGVIKGTAISIWNATSGAVCTVTYDSSSNTSYLTGTKAKDYDILTVQDTTIITNKLKTVTAQAAPAFTANKVGTVRLKAVTANTDYSVSIKIGSTTNTATYTTPDAASADAILTDLKSDIDGWSGDFNNLTVTRLDTTLEISSTVAFTLSGKGGADNERLDTFQNQVANVSSLPDRSKHHREVKILNTSGSEDTYHSRFIADDGVSGTGYWEEYIAPDVSPGLTASTMPHELFNSATNTFVFRPITWINRLVGDDTTNSHPSFVGKKIQQAFFHSSRLGFLVDDNVSMSQTNEFYNFYHVSAMTQIASDPVDLSTSSIRPTLLTGVLPTAQGLILFSKNQQFLMYAPGGILTPTTTIIRGISNYEMDIDIDPVDNGTDIVFVSKTPGYTRIFNMRTRGQEMNPTVLDIGRVVSEYIPATITDLIASPQNSFLAMYGPTKSDIYFYRTHSDGQRDVMQSWFKWQAPGTVQTLAVDSDVMYIVTIQGGKYTLLSANLNQTPEETILVNSEGEKMNPCIDLYATASSVSYDQTDPVNPFSKCYIPFTNDNDLTPVLVIGSDASDLTNPTYVESGFTITPTIGTDGTGTYYKVPFKNLTSVASKVIVGYKYKYDISIPTIYYRLDPEGRTADYTSTLTVARMKFSTGLSGVVSFKLARNGSSEYTEVRPVPSANFYLANDVPLSDQSVLTLPIHQKNTNFNVKVSSESPFPVSLIGMMWEGYYSPRFYRRT